MHIAHQPHIGAGYVIFLCLEVIMAKANRQYFYTKTRNYRIVFGALRTGGKYALALSSATSAYVALDESVGVLRERLVGKHGEGQWQAQESEDGRPRRVGWREGGVWWGDGMIAGGILGLGVGALCTLPSQPFGMC